MSRTALYRFYDHEGDLLYVGVSGSPWSRWKQHQGIKDWAEDVATSTIEWFATRPEAMAAEKDAILAEEPRYNLQHSPFQRVREVRVVEPAPALTVNACCSVCGESITERSGTVQVDLDAVLQQEDYWREQEGSLVVFVDELLDAPPLVEWEIVHFDCDRNPERRLYVIDLADVSTLGRLLETTAHLLEKPWVTYTTWTNILRSTTTGDGPLRIDERFLNPKGTA